MGDKKNKDGKGGKGKEVKFKTKTENNSDSQPSITDALLQRAIERGESGQRLLKEGKPEEALPLLMEAGELFEKRLGNTHHDTALTGLHITKALIMMEEFDKAQKFIRHPLSAFDGAYPDRFRWTLDLLMRLAALLREQDKLEDAERLFRQALALCETRIGPDDLITIKAYNELGVTCLLHGKIPVAEEYFRKGLSHAEGNEEAMKDQGSEFLMNLAEIKILRQEWDQAEAYAQRNLDFVQNIDPIDHAKVMEAWCKLARVYAFTGTEEKFRAATGKASEIEKAALESSPALVLDLIMGLVRLYDQVGLTTEANKIRDELLGSTDEAVLEKCLKEPETSQTFAPLRLRLDAQGHPKSAGVSSSGNESSLDLKFSNIEKTELPFFPFPIDDPYRLTQAILGENFFESSQDFRLDLLLKGRESADRQFLLELFSLDVATWIKTGAKLAETTAYESLSQVPTSVIAGAYEAEVTAPLEVESGLQIAKPYEAEIEQNIASFQSLGNVEKVRQDLCELGFRAMEESFLTTRNGK